MRNPLGSTGLVFRNNDLGQPIFAGTCFGCLSPYQFVTAAHVIGDARPADLGISIYMEGPELQRGLNVTSITVHPTADLAVLRINDSVEIFDYFGGIDQSLEPGADIVSFGYPEDSTEDGPRPIPRMFKAHVQRAFEHNSPLGYSYIAYELSMPVPAGLSGSPVARRDRPSHVAGVIVENRESTLALSKIIEVHDGRREYKEVVHSVTHYGIAVSLAQLRQWFVGLERSRDRRSI